MEIQVGQEEDGHQGDRKEPRGTRSKGTVKMCVMWDCKDGGKSWKRGSMLRWSKIEVETEARSVSQQKNTPQKAEYGIICEYSSVFSAFLY